jgi:lipoprotein-anchoring transpeptidase ErfK/SrfK
MRGGRSAGIITFAIASVLLVAVGWRSGATVPVVTVEATGAPISVPPPPAPTTTLAPEPEPAPPPPPPEPATRRAASTDPTGSRLRLGMARPVGSPATIADAKGPRIGLYSEPGDAEPGLVLKNPTAEGLPVVFLVMDRQGDWIEVQLSRRPHMRTAWVRAADVSLRQTPYKVVVDTGARRLTAYNGGSPILEVPVGIGTGRTPTPTGYFFIDGVVALSNASGPYGSHQLSVAAFSNVLTRFGGGNGQIAIHGTNQPALVGTPVSNGCIRMTNPDVARLASTVPNGTPVEIV